MLVWQCKCVNAPERRGRLPGARGRPRSTAVVLEPSCSSEDLRVVAAILRAVAAAAAHGPLGPRAAAHLDFLRTR